MRESGSCESVGKYLGCQFGLGRITKFVWGEICKIGGVGEEAHAKIDEVRREVVYYQDAER